MTDFIRGKYFYNRVLVFMQRNFFEVVKCVNAVNYVVRKTPHSRPLTVHVSKLKLCKC